MQKPIAIAAIVGSLIIAGALVYHARELSRVSSQLEALEQRSTGLEQRLDKFSSDLPGLVGEAGRDAGRQAFHGVVEEVFQNPVNWFKQAKVQRASTGVPPSNTQIRDDEVTTNQATPWIKFDIPDTVINIQILPQMKELPEFPWPLPERKKQFSSETNQDEHVSQPSPPADNAN